jgi:arylsulfatase A-like enzyme
MSVHRLSLVVALCALSHWAAKRPNIILVLTDDMGKGELGVSGNAIIKTPNLDRFSQQCLRFTNFHVAQSCAPTRAQLMSGRHEFYAGVTHTICDREYLNPKLEILPQYLKKDGYQTGMFGKWHLGGGKKGPGYAPHERGFDEAIFTSNQLGRTNPKLSHNGKMRTFNGYCVDVVFSECMKWVDEIRSRDAPYFAYVATSAPHVPLAAPAEYRELYADAPLTSKAKTYYAMISNIDSNFGKLLGWLDDKKGAKRETIVIFMTDNGHAISGASGAGHDKYGTLSNKGLFNAGMRGGKGQPWQGGTCVPFFMRWPSVVKDGHDDPTLASGMDLLPTLAEIAGIPIKDTGVQGVSLLPNILQEPTGVPDDRLLFSHKGRWHSSEFLQDYQYVYASVCSKRYRLLWNEGQRPELYDYLNDPGEKANIIDQHPELVDTLTTRFNAWWEDSRTHMVNDLAQIQSGKFVSRKTRGTPAQWREQELRTDKK